MSETQHTTQTESAVDDHPLSNWTTTRDPAPLDEESFQDAYCKLGDPVSRPFYAISSEHGNVGGITTGYDAIPKIRVLYASRDGTRSYIRHHAAERDHGLDDGRFAYAHGLLAVDQCDPDAGQETHPDNVDEFRKLVNDLHNRGDLL
jgi:hypothetical protein